MRAAAIALAAVGCAALAGCGGRSADLFSVDRAGSIPGAGLRLVVNDGGTVRCNALADRLLPPKLLVDARELQKDLRLPAERDVHLARGPGSILRYDVRTPDGRVRFADTSPRQPRAFFRLAFFVRRTAKEVCRFAR